MTLAAHSQIGPYRIVSMIGRGGMGEVYRARDARLGRDVAIKMLPTESERNPAFRARLEREARAVAALNHPHICAIYDVGREGTIDYIVFEYITGETLAAILRRGALVLNHTLDYAVQMADGLAAAHEAGVIHRDLKPGNIIIDPAGAVKLLDFGLAKFRDGHILSRESTATALPNVIQTTEGAIVGTLNYMSPEQAEGKPLDARTDIFSFGAVLYEMITNRKAFDGDSSLSVLSSIVRDEPVRIREIATGTPEGLERIVEHCMQKDPRRRFQHMADLKFSLDALKQDLHGRTSAVPSNASTPIPQLRSAMRSRAVAIALAGLSIAVAAFVIQNLGSRAAEPAPITRSIIALADGDSLNISGASVAISQDGRLLAFVANKGPGSRLYLRPLDTFDLRPLPGTEGATNPFFSPRGEWLGFFAEGRLRKIKVDGGTPITLCEAEEGRGATWGPDDTIVFTASAKPGAGLMRISAAGGAPQKLTQPDPSKDETSHRWPEFLPDGKSVLFTIWTSPGLATSRLAVLDLGTGKVHSLSEGGSYARYAPGGYLVFMRTEGLMAARFDPESLKFEGPPAFTGISVLGSSLSGAAQFAIGPSGSLVYAPGVNSSRSIFVWVDQSGGEQPFYEIPGFYQSPRLSPDGKRLVFAALDSGNFDVWVMELARRTLIRLTSDTSAEYFPIWGPDGRHVTYSSNRHGAKNLFSSTADGRVSEERLTSVPDSQFPEQWTRDGAILAFIQFGSDTNSDIWLLNKAAGPPVPFLRTSFVEMYSSFSPDGQWLVYCSNESGTQEVYVTSVKAGGGKWRVSTEGGTEPLWAASGSEIYYRRGDVMMTAVIRTKPAFAVDRIRTLFRGGYKTDQSRSYDVTADGQRFVMLKKIDDQSPPKELHLVSNGLEQFRQKGQLRRQ